MSPKRYIPSFNRFSFCLAFEHHRLTRQSTGKATWADWMTYLMTIDQPIIDDSYAIENFDYMILGDDPVLSLVSALQLGKLGYRVLIKPSQRNDLAPEYYDLFEKRTEMVDRFMYLRLGFGSFDGELNLKNLLKLILDEIEAVNHTNEQPKILIAESSMILNSFQSREQPIEIFWAGGSAIDQNPQIRSSWEYALQGMARFSMLGGEERSKSNRTSPKCKIICQNIVITSHFSSEISGNLSCPVHQLGEAERPIISFESFSVRDRILDILQLEVLRQVVQQKGADAERSTALT